MAHSAHRPRRRRTFTVPIRRLFASRAQLRRLSPSILGTAGTGERAAAETTKARISTTTIAIVTPTVPATPRRAVGTGRAPDRRLTRVAPARPRAAATGRARARRLTRVAPARPRAADTGRARDPRQTRVAPARPRAAAMGRAPGPRAM